MTSKKLAALFRAAPPATAPAELSSQPPLVAVSPEPLPEAPASPPRIRPAPIEPEVPLQVLVPKHIRTQLAVKAAQEGHSLRALVLTAIRSLEIDVTDEEIRDKRGRRTGPMSS